MHMCMPLWLSVCVCVCERHFKMLLLLLCDRFPFSLDQVNTKPIFVEPHAE